MTEPARDARTNFMKKLFAAIVSLAFVACNNAPTVVQQNSNAPAAPERSEKLQTVASHTTENLNPPMRDAAPTPTGGKSKWTQSGEPIDTSEFDAAIAVAEKTVKAKPSDEAAKKALSEAYFKRGVALTDARQYAAAIGDYRKAVKYDPANAEAKNWVEQIIGIYDSINRDYPKEGEEPPPLPFKKS